MVVDSEVKPFSSYDVKQGWDWFWQGFLGPSMPFPHLKVMPLRILGRRLWLAHGSILGKQLESINASQFVQEAHGNYTGDKQQHRNFQSPASISRRTFPAMKIISWLMNKSTFKLWRTLLTFSWLDIYTHSHRLDSRVGRWSPNGLVPATHKILLPLVSRANLLHA